MVRPTTFTDVSLEPLAPAPDDKDWTWVLDSPCPDCGFDAGAVRIADVAPRVRDMAAAFAIMLRRPDAGERPQPGVWSALEYACHVRDGCRVFHQRLRLMLAKDDPVFPNWDQDATALAKRYWTQDPTDRPLVGVGVEPPAMRCQGGTFGLGSPQAPEGCGDAVYRVICT